MIDYRAVDLPADLEQVVSLQIAVWGLNPRNAVPAAILHVIALNGGLVLGAYDGEQIVGLLICLVVKRGSDVFLWSHMTGVHPQYQQLGIGLELKRRQRRWALDHGYRSIRWTFDPLQCGNARFNLHHLGSDASLTAADYHVNFYGDMDDDINRGMPSDRIEVCWQLDQPSQHRDSLEAAPLLVSVGSGGYPISTAADWDQAGYTVAVPDNLEALRRSDPKAVLAWRIAVREALKPAFEHGYVAVDFSPVGGLNVYYLRRMEGKTS